MFALVRDYRETQLEHVYDNIYIEREVIKLPKDPKSLLGLPPIDQIPESVEVEPGDIFDENGLIVCDIELANGSFDKEGFEHCL